MEARIGEFVEVLRQNGLRIGTSELTDALRAVEAVGLHHPEPFQAALEATLVKRATDVDTFRRVFQYFFTGTAKTFEQLDASLFEQLRESGLLEGDELTMVILQLQQLLPSLSPFTQAALSADKAQLGQLLRGASLDLDFGQMQSALQTGFFTRRLLAAAGSDATREDLKALERELQARGVSVKGVEVVSRKLSEALRKVEAAARLEVLRQGKLRLKDEQSGLSVRPFTRLSREELEQAQEAVKVWGQRLKSRLVRKQRAQRRGTLNARRTLRRNLSWGGIPMVPVLRRRRPERPELWVLCDVSDSVRDVSQMMLLFMHTLQSLFVRVRTFVFVSELAELTQDFKALDAEEAVDLSTAGRVISLHSNSNYGRALATFARDHLAGVSRRSTVMIIGDGRNNHNAPQFWALEDLRRKCKRLLWICPEDRRNWGVGDSEMPGYAQICHRAVVVQSLADLQRVASELVPV